MISLSEMKELWVRGTVGCPKWLMVTHASNPGT